jgi:glycerol-1-phosphatase
MEEDQEGSFVSFAPFRGSKVSSSAWHPGRRALQGGSQPGSPLPLLDFATAWRAYLDAAPRLPALPAPVTPRRVAGIAEIAGAFDLVVLDAWGVLNLGDSVIPAAPAAVAELRRRGKRIVVLSNDGSSDKAMAVAKHRRRGFDFAGEEIIAGIDLLPDALSGLPAPERLGLIADDPLPFAALTGRMRRLADRAADYDEVEGFVFLSSDGWSEARQAKLRASMARRRRPLIVGNPDIVSPAPDAIAVEPGHYAHRLAAEFALAPIFLGKPYAAIYRKLAERHPDIAPDRVLCVGDTPHTDILGGRSAGYRAMLVEDGFCRGRDALALCRESGIWPDFIAPRL